jgi:pimeloyl-ACP methyl ester carboxylesterase
MNRLTIATVALGLTLSVAGGSARAQANGDPPPFDPPGRMVDVGGWRLHLNCSGAAGTAPTVILVAGTGDFSVEWSLVQPKVADFTRVCSYDRAGDGWSELGPHPRTIAQNVFELHLLLEKAGVRPPYVFAGQSYGALIARVFTSTYPTEVVGLLLVDDGRLNMMRFINGELKSLPETASGRPVPAVKTSNPLTEKDIPPDAREQILAGARATIPTVNESRDRLPADARRMRTWAAAQIKRYAAYVNPFEAEELAVLVADEKKRQHPLGDLPLIVLTAGRTEYSERRLEDDRRNSHVALAALSRNGKHVIVDNSGHHIHIEQPDIVIQSIRELLNVKQ